MITDSMLKKAAAAAPAEVSEPAETESAAEDPLPADWPDGNLGTSEAAFRTRQFRGFFNGYGKNRKNKRKFIFHLFTSIAFLGDIC